VKEDFLHEVACDLQCVSIHIIGFFVKRTVNTLPGNLIFDHQDFSK